MRPGPGSGIPKRSFSPWITSTGTPTASSSACRLTGGVDAAARRRHEREGEAHTPAAPVAPAVRHATRAPAERPPHDERQAAERPGGELLDDRDPRGVELAGGRGRAPAGDAVGLLDERDAHAGAERRLGAATQVGRLHAAARAVAEHERGDRRVHRMQMRPRRAVGRVDVGGDRVRHRPHDDARGRPPRVSP